MARPVKLTDSDLKRIRRRVRKGEHQTDLAVEFGVNRKTLRRRLDALERAESEDAKRLAEKRLCLQAAREKRKLLEWERSPDFDTELSPQYSQSSDSDRRCAPVGNAFLDWLDRPKNLSGRALSEAMGFVRICLPDGSIRKAVERGEVETWLDRGWLLDDSWRSRQS